MVQTIYIDNSITAKLDYTPKDEQDNVISFDNITLETGARLDVIDPGKLTAYKIDLGKGAILSNSGTLDLEDSLLVQSQNSAATNTGTIETGSFKLRKNATFNMNGGGFTGSGAMTTSTKGYGGTLNIKGGTMSFTDILWYDDIGYADTADTVAETYTIDFSDSVDATLQLKFGTAERLNEVDGFLQKAITNGLIIGAQKTILDEDSEGNPANIIKLSTNAVPEPSSYALIVGCIVLSWRMLRRRVQLIS